MLSLIQWPARPMTRSRRLSYRSVGEVKTILHPPVSGWFGGGATSYVSRPIASASVVTKNGLIRIVLGHEQKTHRPLRPRDVAVQSRSPVPGSLSAFRTLYPPLCCASRNAITAAAPVRCVHVLVACTRCTAGRAPARGSLPCMVDFSRASLPTKPMMETWFRYIVFLLFRPTFSRGTIKQVVPAP